MSQLRLGGPRPSPCHPLPQHVKIHHVTKLKLYYDGWLALPAALRRQLELDTDAVLEAELVGGTIVLRPAARAKSSAKAAPELETSEHPAAAAAPPPAALTTTPAKRKPGRPRKVHAGEREPELRLERPEERAPAEQPQPVSVPKRSPGQPHKIEAQAEPEAASLTGVGAPSELRRRVVLPTALHEHGAVRGRRAARPVHGAGHEREERRPFAHVEVRKLGPGRGHTRPRRLPS